MDINQLRYFKVAAESENLTKSAQSLYITQPALTKAIQRMEAELGTELFGRNGKNVYLTDTGRQVLRYVNNILTVYDVMLQSLSDTPSGHRYILCTNLPNVIRYILPQLNGSMYHDVHALHEAAPLIDQELLLNGTYDCVISQHCYEDPSITNVQLYLDHGILNVPPEHPFSHKACLHFSDLPIDLPLIHTEIVKYSVHTDVMYTALKKYVNIRPVPTLDSGAAEYLCQLSDYFILTSKLTSIFYQPSKRIPVLIDEDELSIPYYISYRSVNQKVLPLVNALKAVFEALVKTDD